MTTLTKSALAQHLSEKIGLPYHESKKMVEQFYEQICASLIKGQPVKLSGFGNFMLRDKRPRPGRNPRTGEEKSISARRVVTFHCGQKLKAQIPTKKE